MPVFEGSLSIQLDCTPFYYCASSLKRNSVCSFQSDFSVVSVTGVSVVSVTESVTGVHRYFEIRNLQPQVDIKWIQQSLRKRLSTFTRLVE